MSNCHAITIREGSSPYGKWQNHPSKACIRLGASITTVEIMPCKHSNRAGFHVGPCILPNTKSTAPCTTTPHNEPKCQVPDYFVVFGELAGLYPTSACKGIESFVSPPKPFCTHGQFYNASKGSSFAGGSKTAGVGGVRAVRAAEIGPAGLFEDLKLTSGVAKLADCRRKYGSLHQSR